MKHIRILKKHGQEVTINIMDSAIGIEMPLEAFLESVAVEMGLPAMLMTRAQLKSALEAAAERVTLEMKRATVSVV